MATRVLRTVMQSGGDHTTLDGAIDWIVANHPNLVTSDVYIDVEISGSWSVDDTVKVDTAGITTDATRYINIYTTGAARHSGVVGASNYKLIVNASSTTALYVRQNFVTVDGLIISSIGFLSSGIQLAGYPVVNSGNIIKNNIIKSCTGSGIYLKGGDVCTNPLVFNNIVYDCGGGIYFSDSSSTSCRIYNNTVYNCVTGIQIDFGHSGCLIKNNLCLNNATADYILNSSTSTTNGSSDATGTSGLTSLTNSTEFVDYVAKDFHIRTGAISKNAGTDLSGVFTTDIDGGTRSGSWDVGADEFGVAASSSSCSSSSSSSSRLLSSSSSCSSSSCRSSSSSSSSRLLSSSSSSCRSSSSSCSSSCRSSSSSSSVAMSRLLITVKQTGGDFDNLRDAVYSITDSHREEQGGEDIVTDGVYVDIEISGPWTVDDTYTVDISGITTGPNNFVRIYTVGESRHSGVVGANNYRLVTTGFLQHAILGNNGTTQYVTIDGLIIASSHSTNPGHGITLPRGINPSGWVVKNNIIHNCNNAIDSNDGVYGAICRNNIIYECSNGIYHYGVVGTSIYNNTFYNNTFYGIYLSFGSASSLVKNNLSIGNAVADYSYAGATTATNGSSDSSGNGGLQSLVAASEFFDVATKNFHLKAGATSIGAGTNLSGIFTDDIDGETRPSTWDLGADEFLTGSSSSSSSMSLSFSSSSSSCLSSSSSSRSCSSSCSSSSSRSCSSSSSSCRSCSSSSSSRSSSSSCRSSSSSCSSSRSSSSTSVGGTIDRSNNPVYIDIQLSDQMKSFMDHRHYDPNEIPYLNLAPTTNGKITWYVDGTNGDDSYDGLYPDHSLGGIHGPFKTPERAWRTEDSHSFGERVLIRTGIYKIPFGTGIGMNLIGTPEDFIIGPYGDGEVVFDFSDTDLVNPFELLSQDIYKATYIDAASIFNPNHIIMDWEMRNARKAKARYGNDNSGVNNKATSMVDTRRNFTVNPCEFFNVPITAVGAMIYNVTDRSYGFVTSLSTTTNPNDTLNFSGGLTGGTVNKFNDNDSYVLIHFDLDGEYFYIDHKKVLKDNSGINGKYFSTTDTTQNFAGYEDGWFQNSSAGGPITSISTTVNLNDTINFAKGLGGQYFDQYVDSGKGTYQWQRIHAYKKLEGSDIYGVATGYYQFINDSIHDSSKDFSGLEGCVVINQTTGSFARVRSIQTKVNPNDCLVCYAFTGGTSQNTTAGDAYRVYRLEDSFNHLLIRSTSKNPDDRNIRIVKSDDTGSAGFRIFNENLKFYGISFICSRSIGLLFLFKKGRIEKCRIMWSGKHAAQLGFLSTGDSTVNKVFVYQNVMNNFPRGSTYGANGGWPQSIQAGGASAYSGVIIYDNGGEGVGGADIFENGIVIDNYSQSIYFEHAGMIIRNNVVGLFYYDEADWLQRFYYEDSYNFAARNSQKMHVGGITMAAEISGPHFTIADIEIYNNIILGCFEGISQYYEWGPNGLVNSFIANNTIILPSNHVLAPFEPCAGIKIRPSTIDTNSFIKNNIIIGSVLGLTYGDASRVNIFRCRDNGITTANIVCDKNLYSYPGISIPFTLTSDSAFNPSTFTQWKAFTGWDTNTTLTDTPDLVGTSTQWLTIENIHKKHLKLLVSSIGVNTGENLSAYFNMDFDGNSRNSSGGWDKGAILYQEERKDYTKEALSVDLPVDDTNLAIEFIPVEYSYVDNEDFVFSEIEARNQISVFLFKDRNNSGETEFTIRSKVRSNLAASIRPIRLQIFNTNSNSWETLATNTTAASGEQISFQETKSSNLSDYYNAEYQIACRIYQENT